MPKLYMFYLGGNAGRSNIEVHDIQFAVCDDYREAIPALKAAWFGDADKIHIDGWQVVEWADGYDITVSEQPAGDERPSETRRACISPTSAAIWPDSLRKRTHSACLLPQILSKLKPKP